MFRRRQLIQFGITLLMETGISEPEERFRSGLLFAAGNFNGPHKNTCARIDDNREILDQVALRLRREKRSERYILQNHIRHDAERAVSIEVLADRRNQQS